MVLQKRQQKEPESDKRTPSMENGKNYNGSSKMEPNGASNQETTSSSSSSSSSKSLLLQVMTVSWVALHVLASGMVVYGIILSHTSVFHHKECDMTYSWRTYLQVDMPQPQQQEEEPFSSPYKLYQFLDQRDTRHRKMLQSKEQGSLLQEKEGCLKNTSTATVVLYVPGHGGDYQQSRSLGAHGIQLPEYDDGWRRSTVQQSLINGTFHGDSSAVAIDDFVYEVYALDFGEEGTGLHGRLIQEQSDFIAQAIRYLTMSEQSCQYPSLIIVAHSMGGISARLALARNPDIRHVVPTLITLGTPHQYPVLAFDSSVHQIHQEMLQQENTTLANTVLISIAGGLRDEMIPPTSCQTRHKRSLAILATSIMKPGVVEANHVPVALGMDHRAIVWCRNLLSQVRSVIYLVTKADREGIKPRSKLQRVQRELGLLHNYDYDHSVQQAHKKMHQELGWWNALAVEAGFQYNANVLLQSYLVLGGCYNIWGVDSVTSVGGLVLTVVWLVFQQTRSYVNLSPHSIALLSLTADSIFWALFLILWRLQHYFRARRIIQTTNPRSDKRGIPILGLLLFGLFVTPFFLATITEWAGWTRAVSVCLLYAYYLVLTILAAPASSTLPTFTSDTDAAFGAFSIPVIPISVAGHVYLSILRPRAEFTGNDYSCTMVLLFSCARYMISGAFDKRNQVSRPHHAVTIVPRMIRGIVLLLYLVDGVNLGGDWLVGLFAIVDAIEALFGFKFAKDSHEHQD